MTSRTTRNVTATQPGPVRVHVTMPFGSISMTTSPEFTTATATLQTPATHGPAADLVATATMTAVGDRIDIQIRPTPVMQSVTFTSGPYPYINHGVHSSGPGNPTFSSNTVIGSMTAGVVNFGGSVIGSAASMAGFDPTTDLTADRLDLIIDAPPGSELVVTSGTAADITTRGPLKNITLDGTAATVDIDEVGTLDASFLGGHVRVANLTGTADLNFVGGHVEIHGADNARVNIRGVGAQVRYGNNLAVNSQVVGGSFQSVRQP
jgi:hypothetical protein